MPSVKNFEFYTKLRFIRVFFPKNDKGLIKIEDTTRNIIHIIPDIPTHPDDFDFYSILIHTIHIKAIIEERPCCRKHWQWKISFNE
jgi:hypothetical protein